MLYVRAEKLYGEKYKMLNWKKTVWLVMKMYEPLFKALAATGNIHGRFGIPDFHSRVSGTRHQSIFRQPTLTQHANELGPP